MRKDICSPDTNSVHWNVVYSMSLNILQKCVEPAAQVEGTLVAFEEDETTVSLMLLAR